VTQKRERQREKEESDAQGGSESHIYMGRGKEKGTALLVFSHAMPACPMKVKIYETEEV
jgi:hypothetical protein